MKITLLTCSKNPPSPTTTTTSTTTGLLSYTVLYYITLYLVSIAILQECSMIQFIPATTMTTGLL